MPTSEDGTTESASREPTRVIFFSQVTGHNVHLSRVARLLGPEIEAIHVGLKLKVRKGGRLRSSIIRQILASVVFSSLTFTMQLLPNDVNRRLFLGRSYLLLRRLAGESHQVEVLHRLFEAEEQLNLSQKRTVVVLAEENLLAGGLVVGWFMRRHGVRTIVFNYTTGVEAEWVDYFTRLPTPRTLLHVGPYGRRFCRATDSGQIRLPAKNILQALIFCSVPEQPWSGYVGMASAYLVDSRDEAQRMGFLAHKMHVVEPVEAILATRLAYSLEPSERFSGIGIALPPNQWAGTESGERAYEDFLRRLAIVVEKINSEVPVIISPHPRLGWPIEVLRAIFGIEADRFVSLEELFARSMALLQFGSASFRIAEAMGTPIVDWDLFGYGTMRKLRPEPSQMLRHVTDEVGAVRELKKLMAKTGTGLGLPTTIWKGAEIIRSIAEEELG